MSVGERIKEIRTKRGWTQGELADRSGLSRVTINNLETGKQTVTTNRTIQALADACCCKPSFFLS